MTNEEHDAQADRGPGDMKAIRDLIARAGALAEELRESEAQARATHAERYANDPAYRDECIRQQQEAAAAREESSLRQLINRGFPERELRMASIDAIDDPERAAIRAVLRSGRLPIVWWFQGAGGVGKTCAACVVARWCRETGGRAPRFATLLDVLDATRTGEHERFERPRLLVLDEFTLDTNPAPWQALRVEGILRNRRSKGRPTLITTNLRDLTPIVDVFGGPILRVLFGDDADVLIWESDTCRETGRRGLWRNH